MLLLEKNAKHIVEELKSIIHRDINIMDCTGRIIASTNPLRYGTIHQGALCIIKNKLPMLTIWEDDPKANVQRGVNLTVTIDNQIVGIIGITGDPNEVQLLGNIIQRMTEVMLKEMQWQEEAALMDKAKLAFVENWLFSSRPDLTELEIRGHLLGFNIADPYTVVIMEISSKLKKNLSNHEELPETQNSRLLNLIWNHLKQNKKNFCAVINNRILLLLYNITKETTQTLLDKICSNIYTFYGIRVCCGVSHISTGGLDIRRCYDEAITAKFVAEQIVGQPISFYTQKAIEFIVYSIPLKIRQDVHYLIFSNCADKEKEEFMQTIQYYFRYDGDIKKCADVLYVHRNTFQYRVERILKKTGYDLRKQKDSFILYLSAQINNG